MAEVFQYYTDFHFRSHRSLNSGFRKLHEYGSVPTHHQKLQINTAKRGVSLLGVKDVFAVYSKLRIFGVIALFEVHTKTAHCMQIVD